jgi:hypothetical protein
MFVSLTQSAGSINLSAYDCQATEIASSQTLPTLALP